METQQTFATPFGTCTIRWSGSKVIGFRLPAGPGAAGADGSQAASATVAEAAWLPSAVDVPAEIEALIDRVRRHLGGDLQEFRDVNYAWEAVSPFQEAVLRATLAVSPGRTASYGEIATKIGEPLSSSRAVAAALGANPWPLLVPCHRIVGSDGKMTGFSAPGGIRTKVRLLALEGAQLLAE